MDQLQGRDTLLKIIFLLLLVFFLIYFYHILRVLGKAKKEMERMTIERMKQKDQSFDETSPDEGEKTYELDSNDYNIDK